MCARALPVTTKRSQVGDGVCDFDVTISTLIAVIEFGGQWSNPPIDFGANAGITYFGVYRIREIDKRCAFWQFNQIAFWR